MAEGGGPGRGRGGRGAIIAKLLELEKRPGQHPVTAAGDEHPSAAVQEAAPLPSHRPPTIGGRGAMLQRLQQAAQQAPEKQPEQTPLPVQPPPPAVVPMTLGRGRLLQMAMGGQTAPVLPKPELPSAPPVIAEPDVKSATRQMRRLEISTDRPPVVMRGKEGTEKNATANYIPLYLQPGRGVFEYEVRFSPPVDDRSFCEKLLFFQHKDVFGHRRRTFDGVTLFVPQKLPEEAMNLTSTHPITGEAHTIKITFRRQKPIEECTQMFNILFNIIQRELNLVRLGREFFSQELATTIPQHRLEVWPGYVTSVDCFEGGIMLNCNASHKVLRTQTVLNLMDEIIHAQPHNWKNILQKMLIGQSVMTRKPVNIYRVDDIDFNQNPTCTFQKSDGTEMTYIEYQRVRGVTVRDEQQPLLVHRPKPSKRQSGTELIMLVPELCFLTGLTDEMRADFKIMKDVATYTRVNPNQRQRTLKKFIDNIRNSENCVKLLDEWGLQVPERTTELTARVLPAERIYFHKHDEISGADWGRAATSNYMLEVVDINEWIVVHTQRDERNASAFIEMMKKCCPQMGVSITYPKSEKIRDDKTETYLRALKGALNRNTQLAVIIFPSARDDRYAAIKKLCCVDQPIPSQVINSRTISKPDKLRSIVQKIALQINCKLGGALWAVKIPFKRAMICGIDTYHDSKNRAQSVAGFVASMNTDVTRWHSQVFMQSSDREMVDGLRVAMLTALHKYYEVNNVHPDQIIVYRDGVGDGQLNVCEQHEVATMRKAFTTISPDYDPPMVFIVCQKRINTRIFIPERNGDYTNPPPGSVVDHTITRRYLHDFFLVSQLVRQGTVTPTHYVVLYNTTRLDPDKLQKLTYKMCHLYYNWPGTIRVPAPCQYAHKLAHLVGCSVHKEPANVLCDKLFFL